MSDSGGRRRARSRSYTSEELMADIDGGVAADGPPAGPDSSPSGSAGAGRSRSGSQSSGSSGGRSGGSNTGSRKVPALSQRTRNILSLHADPRDQHMSPTKPPSAFEQAYDDDMEDEEEARYREATKRRDEAEAKRAGAAAAGAGSGPSAPTDTLSTSGPAASGSSGTGESSDGASGTSGPREPGEFRLERIFRSPGSEAIRHDKQVKLLMLGDSGVGKTSLLMRYSQDKFIEGVLSTAGVTFQTQYFNAEGLKIRCDFWDTAGQDRFHVITQAYYAGSHGIILVYDAADHTEQSFQNVRYWMDNIRKHASPNCVKVLLGNKSDLPDRAISKEQGQEVADEYGMEFFETSAKTGFNVEQAFFDIAKTAIAKQVKIGAIELPDGIGAGAGATGKGAAGKGGKSDRCTIS